MANQDVLFPFLPRNTRVDLSERNLRVKRIQSTARAAQVEEDVQLGTTPQTPVRDYVHQRQQQESDSSADTSEEEVTDGENQATHQLPEPAAVAEDPRRKNLTQDDDRHKGVHLDTFV